MRLLEWESKQILKKYGINIPEGQIVSKGELPNFEYPCVLKVQVPVGGRGKAGGVIEVDSANALKEKMEKLFETTLHGYKATKLLMEKKIDKKAEFYLGITYDTVLKKPLAIFSREGGVDIEEIAQREPWKLHKEPFSFTGGLPEYRAREIISATGVSGKLLVQLGSVLAKLARVFIETDAIIAEINPLALDSSEKLVALDCHLELDDDALFRHNDIARLCSDEKRYISEKKISEFEQKAEEIDNLDHRGVAGRVIEFDGDVGLIIGGGGASLTAFDAILDHGGKPANYCEIGGNPSVKKVKELTKLILSKPGVKKIAVIMNVVSNTRVDLVARGVIKGVLETGKKPSDTIAVFRIPGAWEEEGFKILSKYGVRYCDRRVSIDEAAKIAVKNIGG